MYCTPGHIDLQSIVKDTRATRNNGGYLGHCPAHRDRTPSLSIGIGEAGKLLLKCHAGCEFIAIIQAIGIAGGGSVLSPLKASRTDNDRENSERAVRRIWNDTIPIEPGDPVDRYLRQTRGLALGDLPPDLRYHSALDFWMEKLIREPGDMFPSECVGSYPAMVAAVRNLNGELVGVHRTYLTNTGEKLSESRDGRRIENPRKQRAIFDGATRGGAIRLGEVENKVLIAEGIETALAGFLLSGLPAWAAMSAGGLGEVELPDDVKEVLVCVDNDAAGEKAARKLASRMMKIGKKVSIARAGRVLKDAKSDWADLLERSS